MEEQVHFYLHLKSTLKSIHINSLEIYKEFMILYV